MYINIFRAFRILTVSLALTHAGTCAVSAQDYVNTPVSISKEKVKINGKLCYSHVVLEKQTLFSISKAYNVSIDEIYKLNPTLKETGLVKNSIIVIPIAEKAVSVQEKEPEAVMKEVESGQIRQEEKSEELKEPVAETPKKKKKLVHTVKWYESLEDIASKYGVSVEGIMAANKLSDRKIKSRMKLTIPEEDELSTDQLTADMNDHQIDAANITEELQIDSTAANETSIWPLDRKEKVNTALLLPFKANGTSGSRSNMDFYSGILLAINDLGQNGISTDLSVFDISNEGFDLARSGVGNCDIVIGPVSTNDITQVIAGADTNTVIISPLDPKAERLVTENSNMIQAPAPYKIQYDDLAAWIKEDARPQDRVILISEKGARPTEATVEMRQSVDSAGVTYNTFSYSILEGRDIMDPLKNLMTLDGTNRVLITSESEAFVNDVVRNLNLMLHQKYDVVLYGASKIRSYETIEVENFHKTNLHVSLTYYIDYNDPRVKNFLLKYRALFNAEPTQFAYQGYDIATCFIEMRSKYGKDWMGRLSAEEKSLLQSTFKCIKRDDGGYINHGVRRIVYGKDWIISKVK